MKHLTKAFLTLKIWRDKHGQDLIEYALMAGFVAVAAGAPVSTAILVGFNGILGLAGWKWMFIAEAVPTVLVGFFILFFVTDRPHLAHWLNDDERKWLIETLETERGLVEARHKVSFWRSFWDPKILLLTLNYFGIVGSSVGMLLFVPQIVKQLGLSNMQVGWVSMIPYLCGAVAMIAWGWYSDRTGERRWNLFWACIVATAGLIIAGQTVGTAWALVGMSIAAIGFYGSKGPFWSMPPAMLTGTAAAAGSCLLRSFPALCDGMDMVAPVSFAAAAHPRRCPVDRIFRAPARFPLR